MSPVDEEARLRCRFEEEGGHLTVQYSPGLFRHQLGDESREILALIEEHHHIDAVLAQSPLSEFETLTALADLVQAGIVTISQPEDER